MRFIFVGGCERSGTTLAQRLLAAHSKIVGGPEFVFTPHVAELYQRMSRDYPAAWAERVAQHYSADEVRSAFRNFYTGFFARRRESKPDAAFVSEKTPGNIRVARILLELFPDAFFVHVLRDGRDVLASHRTVLRRLQAGPNPGFEPAGFGLRAVCGRWNRALDTHFELQGDVTVAPRYLALRYEALVSDPESTLNDLLQGFGLTLEPALLEPDKLGTNTATVPADGYWITEEMLARPFDTGSVGRWRKDLPLPLKLAAEYLMRRNLQRFERHP